MIHLPPQKVVEMAPADLAQRVLADMVRSQPFSAWNYINEAQQGQYRGDAAAAISGAIGWLTGQGLIAHDPRNGSSWGAMVITPAGYRAAGGA
jgi:hypothetical protein